MSILWALGLALRPFPPIRQEIWLEPEDPWELLGPRLRALKRHGWITCRRVNQRPALRLTESGQRAACHGVDPPALWNRPWDGRWRMLVFDVPLNQPAVRTKLWRWLRCQRFGLLQQSVWITPDPIDATKLPVIAGGPAANRCLISEGATIPDTSNLHLVDSAWDFRAINRSYGQAIGFLRRTHPRKSPRASTLTASLVHAHAAWREAAAHDPFLPRALWPPGYLGETAFAASGLGGWAPPNY